MNKYITPILIAAALTGCQRQPTPPVATSSTSRVLAADKTKSTIHNPVLYVDHGTGCHYLGNGHGLTPRMGRDGSHICRDSDIGK